MVDRTRAGEMLDRLRSGVDLAPYTPPADAPEWLSGLAAVAHRDPGVLALLGRTGVVLRSAAGARARELPDAAAVYLAGVADRLRGTGKGVAVGIPPAGRHLPLLLAASAVLADALDRARGISDPSSGVLVVSPDLDIRSRYCDLYVGQEQIDAHYAGSRMTPDGRRIPLRPASAPKGRGVCFLLPRLVLPDTVGSPPALVLVDLRYARWVNRAADLVAWLARVAPRAGVVALYTLGDGDTAAALASARYTELPLDHRAIATCVAAGSSRSPAPPTVDWSLGDAAAFLARRHEIRQIEDAEDVCQQISDIGELLDAERRRDSADFRRARWLFAVMAQLPVPMVWYEQTAQALGRSSLRRMIAIWELDPTAATTRGRSSRRCALASMRST